MYGYLSKTKQSLALKLMAIYTLKSNILVHFSHLNYLLVLSRFKSLYFHFCETALNCYRFIHQSSPFKSLYSFSPFRIKLFFGTPSKLLFKTRLILFGYTNLLALDIAPIALTYHIFGHIKFIIYCAKSRDRPSTWFTSCQCQSPRPRALSSMQNFQIAISRSFLNRFTSGFWTK